MGLYDNCTKLGDLFDEQVVVGVKRLGEDVVLKPQPRTFEPVVSENKDWFVKSSAWMGRLSRGLVRMGGKYDQAIDISIQTLNQPFDRSKGFDDYETSNLLEMRIRRHRTTEKKENFFHVLHGGIANSIKELVGEYFYNFLIHVDILAAIDNEKLDHYDRHWYWGGGVPFILIAKNPDDFKPILEHWFRVLDREPHYLQAMEQLMVDRYLNSSEERKEKVSSIVIANTLGTHGQMELFHQHGERRISVMVTKEDLTQQQVGSVVELVPTADKIKFKVFYDRDVKPLAGKDLEGFVLEKNMNSKFVLIRK